MVSVAEKQMHVIVRERLRETLVASMTALAIHAKKLSIEVVRVLREGFLLFPCDEQHNRVLAGRSEHPAADRVERRVPHRVQPKTAVRTPRRSEVDRIEQASVVLSRRVAGRGDRSEPINVQHSQRRGRATRSSSWGEY